MADDLRQHPPTARRLRKLHEAGIFPHSQVLTAAWILLVALLILFVAGPTLLDLLGNLVHNTLAQAHLTSSLDSLDNSLLMPVFLSLAALLVVIWAVALLVTSLQRGFSVSSGAARLVPGEPSITTGQRSRSLDLTWDLIVSLAILGGAALIILGNVRALVAIPPPQPAELVAWLRQIGWDFGWRFATLLVGLGVCDYLYQRAIFAQSAAMTRRELEEEIRETEGPWLVRWWRQRRMRGIAPK